MLRLPFLLLLLLLSPLLQRGSPFLNPPKELLDNGQICVQNQRCKSACCRRSPEPKTCESHCTPRSPEGGKCNTQIFLGLYSECPCESNLTCVYPKNQKSFKVIDGSCQKHKPRKPSMKTIF